MLVAVVVVETLVLALLSIGIFYLPEVVLLFVAVRWQRPPGQGSAASRQYAA